jgi:hypothetical protein
MRWFVVAAVLVALLGVVLWVAQPGLVWGSGLMWGPWPAVLGIAGALLILSAGLIRESRRGS